ncbi:Hydrolase OS=Streptomyces fumanus OX=67302 GN=GCM10018772_55590 PE=4 SV=1 [Streptomyces fumanus]
MPGASVSAAALRRRAALLCAAAALAASCGRGAAEDAGEGPLPGAPTGVTAAGSAHSVHVMWNAIPGAETYEVYRGRTKVKDVPGSERMVDVTRLRPSTEYVFTVRARDGEGRLGPRSRAVRATTPAVVAADGTAPTRPGDLRGRRDGGAPSRAVTDRVRGT